MSSDPELPRAAALRRGHGLRAPCEDRAPGHRSGLLPRTRAELYIGQLGILKAGGAFACIDPAFPDWQVQTVLASSGAVAVLTDQAGAGRLRALGTTVPLLDIVDGDARPGPAGMAVTEPALLAPRHLAYLVYTSGTTGQPKGVMIEHRSIVNLVEGDLATLGVTPHDRVAQNSSPAYDSSIEETWFALAAGATLVVMDEDAVRLGPDLVAWLRRERITMFCPPPTLLRSTGCVDPAATLPELRLLHPGGEALAPDVADLWAPGRRLVNDYGPTETTVTAWSSVPGSRMLPTPTCCASRIR
ncbi:MAG: AMP-binding protein [Gammaproteobacteria bacterium]|nr:AMP-binding protein [Gammaproteobacteria bacterium]